MASCNTYTTAVATFFVNFDYSPFNVTCYLRCKYKMQAAGQFVSFVTKGKIIYLCPVWKDYISPCFLKALTNTR